MATAKQKAAQAAATTTTPTTDGAAEQQTPPASETTKAAAVVNDITRLEVARALPEITGDAKTSKPKAAEGAIERFYSADDRLMVVVEFKGALHCMQIAEPTDRDNAEA